MFMSHHAPRMMASGGLGMQELDAEECRFNFPPEGILMQMFRGAVQSHMEGQQIALLNELEMRAFLCRVVLGQVLSFARKRAEGFYENDLEPLKKHVAQEYFRISVEALDGAILRSINDDDDEEEEQHEDEREREMTQLACQFLDRESFITMYVGCTVLSIVPFIYSMIYPTLMVPGSNEISGNRYETLISNTASFYEDKLRLASDLSVDGQ